MKESVAGEKRLPMWRATGLIVLSLLLMSVFLSFAQEKKAARLIRIGVAKSASHPTLDADEKGFEKALSDAGFKEGVNVVYDRHNAEGDSSNARSIAQKLLETKADLIHSIATLTSQAVVRTSKNIPIVFSAVNDPMEAGVVSRSSPPGTRTGTNVTGASDHLPVYQQFEMFMKIVPKARRWGTIYNVGDAHSLVRIKEMREAAKKLGVELTEATISNRGETAQAAQFLAGKVQALQITSDPMVIASFEVIAKVCSEKKIPLFASDVSTVSRGGIAAYGIEYFLVGLSAGSKASRILSGQKAGDIPWGPSDKFILAINEKAAKAQGVAIPLDLLKIADRVISDKP
jgi:putative tryptophan/tyrosine transport system substrate-binding protein